MVSRQSFVGLGAYSSKKTPFTLGKVLIGIGVSGGNGVGGIGRQAARPANDDATGAKVIPFPRAPRLPMHR